MASLEERINARIRELSGPSLEDRIAAREAELSQTVVAETPDGGRVIRNAQGALSYTSPGYSTNDPAKIEQIMQGATGGRVSRQGINEQLIGEHPIAARAAKVVQGVPFVGEYIDEAVGYFNPKAGQAMRATQDAMEEERPGQSLGLRLTGGVAGSAPLAALAPVARIPLPKSMLGKVTTGVAAGAVAGGTEGAISGYGRGTGKERVENATSDAVAGTMFGAGTGGLAPLAYSGIRNLAQYFKRSDVDVIAKELGISKPAARIVKGHLRNDDIDAAEDVLRRLGDDGMLADAGEATAQALDTAMADGGAALTRARRAIEARSNASRGALASTFDRVLGIPRGMRAAGREVAGRTAAVRQKAYRAAFQQPIDYSAREGLRIEEIFSRIPAKTLRSAIDEANEAMTAEGRRNLQILADIGGDGTVSFREMPNLEQLNQIKIALQNIGQPDAFGQMTSQALRASKLARELRDAMTDAVPAYGRALRLGGDKIAETNALKMGRGLFSSNTTLEDITDAMNGASREQKEAFAVGLRAAIEDQMGRVKAVASDPNVDAREARKIIQDLSSRVNRAKVEAALGKSRADALFRVLDREGVKFNTQARVARNSQTAIRQSGREAVKAETATGVVGELAEGNPIGSARRFIQVLTRRTPEARQEELAGTMEDIAKALTETRGADAERALRLINKSMKGQALSDAEARYVARIATETGAIASYQTGTQSLEAR